MGWLSLGGAIYKAPTVLINVHICIVSEIFVDIVDLEGIFHIGRTSTGADAGKQIT